MRIHFVCSVVMVAACAVEGDEVGELDGDGDGDGDGIADRADNCPVARNAAQLDRDGDGAGDACDLTIVAGGKLRQTTPAGRLGPAMIAVAEIANFSGAEQRYAVVTTTPLIVPEEAEGIVANGEIRTLYAAADGRELVAGQEIAGRLSVTAGGKTQTVDRVAELIIGGQCMYWMRRDFITVTDGEGGFSPGLELDVDTSIDYAGGTATLNWSGNLSVGASVSGDADIYSDLVPIGTVVFHSWGVSAREEDDWDADDFGSGGGNISFTCSTTSSTRTDNDRVTLGNAEISVGVKAVW